MSRYQKGKTNLDFTEARDSEWQRHQLRRMQVCTQLQTANHASTPPLSFFTGRMLFLSPNWQCQSTEGNTSLSSFVLNCNCMHHLDLQPPTLPPYFSDWRLVICRLNGCCKLYDIRYLCTCIWFVGFIGAIVRVYICRHTAIVRLIAFILNRSLNVGFWLPMCINSRLELWNIMSLLCYVMYSWFSLMFKCHLIAHFSEEAGFLFAPMNFFLQLYRDSHWR